MKSVVVLLYAFLSATALRTIANNFSHIKSKKDKLMYSFIETFVT